MTASRLFAHAFDFCRTSRPALSTPVAADRLAGFGLAPYQALGARHVLVLAPRLDDAALIALAQIWSALKLSIVHAGGNPASATGAGHEALILAVTAGADTALPTLPECRRLGAELGLDLGLSRRPRPWRWPAGAVFDMDSTLISMEVIDELALAAGPEVGAKVAAITESAMRGELDFNASLQARVQALSGLPLTVFEQVRSDMRFNPGVVDFAAAARAEGCRLAVVSGGFVPFAESVQARLQFDYARANTLADDGAALTGVVLGEVVNAAVKARTLQSLAAEWDCPAVELMAVGDGANDALMLQAAGFSVAFRAKPALREQADLALEICDMAALSALFVNDAQGRSER